MAKEKLIGVWQLEEYKVLYDDNSEQYPFGQDAAGCIIYTPCGYMSVQVMRSNRIKSLSTKDYFAITTEEKLEIADNFLSYTGTYEVSGTTVTHYPFIGSFKNFIDVPQHRQYNFIDQRLLLSSMHLATNEKTKYSSSLTWKQISALENNTLDTVTSAVCS